LKITKGVIPKECWTISVLVICAVSLFINATSFAQNSSLIGSAVTANNQSRVELSKVATSTTLITNDTAFVGGFDAAYSITGTPMNIKDSKDLIISSIVKDFAKSSTVGYVKISKSMSNSSVKTEIANPFASNEQINQQIQDLLSKPIEDATNSRAELIEIKCLFGNSLDLFSCTAFPLLS
jgi:hypothetical protein